MDDLVELHVALKIRRLLEAMSIPTFAPRHTMNIPVPELKNCHSSRKGRTQVAHCSAYSADLETRAVFVGQGPQSEGLPHES